MRFRSLVAILRHGGADLTALVRGLRRGRIGQCERQPRRSQQYGSEHHVITIVPKVALPVAATATEVSSAAEQQKEHDDNQEQFHGSLR